MERKKITATELAKSLSEVLSRVFYRGESFVIERNGKAVATVDPPEPKAEVTFGQLGDLLKDAPWPLEGFADDLEAIQSSQEKIGAPEWDS